jgi:hypothetical protein
MCEGKRHQYHMNRPEPGVGKKRGVARRLGD